MFEQLSGQALGEQLLIPENTLKADSDVFLCNMTLRELSDRLNVDIKVSANDGAQLISNILGVQL